MKNRWEKFAQENAEYFIDTTHQDEGLAQFFKSGQDFTAKTLDRVEGLLPDYERALEIGSGIGRLTLSHARKFDEVLAVDVAPTMLQKLKQHANNKGIGNVKTFLPGEAWDTEPVSYAYSYLVFQHIEAYSEIEDYIKRTAECLKQNGIAQFLFDTRSRGAFYKLRNHLPDFLLPQTQRRGIRRIRRKPDKLCKSFQKFEFDILEVFHPNTKKHTYVLKKC